MDCTIVHQAYHKAYDNPLYRGIAMAVALDRRIAADAMEVSVYMNMVTDTCFELCGDNENHKDAHLKLARMCGSLTRPTIRRIHDYLARFTQPGDPRLQAFEYTARALASYQRGEFFDMTTDVSAIPSWRGRMAHRFLVATAYLQTAAYLLVAGEEDTAYIREKINGGITSVINGLLEGDKKAFSFRKTLKLP